MTEAARSSINVYRRDRDQWIWAEAQKTADEAGISISVLIALALKHFLATGDIQGPTIVPKVPARERCEHGESWNEMPYSHYSIYHKEDHP